MSIDPDPPTPERLLQLAQAGDEQAGGQLLELYRSCNSPCWCWESCHEPGSPRA